MVPHSPSAAFGPSPFSGGRRRHLRCGWPRPAQAMHCRFHTFYFIGRDLQVASLIEIESGRERNNNTKKSCRQICGFQVAAESIIQNKGGFWRNGFYVLLFLPAPYSNSIRPAAWRSR